MRINPAIVGVGAAVGTGLAVGFGSTAIGDSIARRHPTGSDADRPAQRVFWAAAGLGFASAAAGMAALATGRLALGAGLFGAGAGAMIGSFGGAMAFGSRHGVGVDTAVQGYLDGYDHDRSGQLELADRGWFHPSESIRTERTSHEDSDGDTHWETHSYSIDWLVDAADTDMDRIVTRDELTTTVGGYDADGDGRLQGDELERFQRELGEQQLS